MSKKEQRSGEEEEKEAARQESERGSSTPQYNTVAAPDAVDLQVLPP